MSDLPQFVASSYASAAVPIVGIWDPNQGACDPVWHRDRRVNLDAAIHQVNAANMAKAPKPVFIEENAMPNRRIVKVIIADPNDNVPLDQCLLYSGEEKLTDLTDQELFYEINIKNLLDEYNTKRVTWRDKSVKDREQLLEPARIRDLKMVVVTVATL